MTFTGSKAAKVASQGNSPSLAKLWAKRYVRDLVSYSQLSVERDRTGLVEANSPEGRAQTVTKLLRSLNFASAQAWGTTEQLLSEQVKKHQIDPQYINPWQVARDSYHIFEKVLEAYREGKTPQSLVNIIGPDCSQIRKAATEQDPRVLGFTSMQIHYTGRMLMDPLSTEERLLATEYFKVVDDHLYMPLQRAYSAAASYDERSPVLKAVQTLLPASSVIAKQISETVLIAHPNYRCYSGFLKESQVRISSIRDIEMFQLYLCVCLLEQDISAVQGELFPLCIMIYPVLGVHWWLVRELVSLLGQTIHKYLPEDVGQMFCPYVEAIEAIFSQDVVGL